MRLTAFTDFGLRALMRLAASPNQILTTEQIAKQLQISRNHLTKVAQDLVRAGFVQSIRGSGGGLKLAREAGSIHVGEVVRFLEREHAIVECFRSDGGNCILAPKCKLKAKLAQAREVFLKSLDETSLADIAA